MGNISLLSADAYDVHLLRKIVRKHFANLNVPELIAGKNVLIKPNIIMRSDPERGATSHPAFLEALILELQALNVPSIAVADSPGGPYNPPVLRNHYEGAGLWSAAEKCGIMCNLDISSRTVVRRENQLCKTFELIAPVLEKNLFIINFCKVKTHSMMTFTCGVKNLFGTIPGMNKAQMHVKYPEYSQFAKMLVDLCETVAPDLTIADGIVGMEGDGPTAGTPIPFHVTAAALSKDIYAMDLLLSHMIGMKPEQVPTVKESIRRGLCPANACDVAVCGEEALRHRMMTFTLPKSMSLSLFLSFFSSFTGISSLMQNLSAPHPVVRAKDCVGCRKCANACPVHTIHMRRKKSSTGKAEPLKAFVDKSKCIRCYCCHELCPAKAIDIKRGPFT